jgi:hypothetical protein
LAGTFFTSYAQRRASFTAVSEASTPVVITDVQHKKPDLQLRIQ